MSAAVHLPVAPAMQPYVIVIGGGLAGMAAAVALHSAGARVTLVEARSTLGGRAGSFIDPQTGEKLDNCQHVLLGCCTNLIDFYKRLGVADWITWERSIHFADARGEIFDLWGVAGVPAPLNLGPSLAAFDALTVRERMALIRAMLAMLRLGTRGRLELEEEPFGKWLDRHGQPQSLVEKFYDPIVVSGLNENTRDASAAYAIQIFQDAMLANSRGYVMGLPSVPLEQLYSRLPCPDVRLSTRVAALKTDANGARVQLVGGEELVADAVVIATNYHTTRRWIEPGDAGADGRFARLERLTSVPILGAHLFFDRPVLSRSHVAFMKGPLQWLFRKNADGSAVHGVISAARDWTGRAKDECMAMFEQQVQEMIPGAANAKLVRGVIVIEKRATFSPLPGVDRLRPAQAPPCWGLSSVYLAGDWTATGWPATMEGAVRSGYLAADAVVEHFKLPPPPGGTFLVKDLPVEWPARLLGLRRTNQK